VSRGLGPVQLKILDVLGENLPEGALIVGELNAALGGDRSNTRRAVRGLLRRDLVEEVEDAEGHKPIRLTNFGVLFSMPPPAISTKSPTYRSKEWERRHPTVGRRPDRAPAKQNLSGSSSPPRVRAPGSIERLILGVLWEHPGSRRAGMPVRELKVLIVDDRSNIRRAIRNLLRRGWIEESDDGRHLRLTYRGYFFAQMFLIPDDGPPGGASR